MTRTCDHCGDEFGDNEEFMEIGPCYFNRGEQLRENMAWQVHWSEADEFVQYLRSEYNFGSEQ